MKLLERHRVFLFQNYLLYIISFLIPLYPKLTPICILLVGLLSILTIARGYSRFDISEVSILMLILFAMHMVGLSFSDNMPRGWFDVEVKLSLFAFPVVFIGFRFLNATNYDRMLRYFLYGSLTAAGFCLLQSTYKYFVLGKPYYYFLTSRFSVIVHQSYFALYLIFSMVILVYLHWNKRHEMTYKSIAWLIVQFTFLSLAVVLTGSKIGFLMWLVTLLGVTVLLIKEMSQKWVPVIGLVLLTSGVGVLFQQAPLLQSRIVNVLKVAQSDQVNPQSNESTALRYLVYTASWDVIMSQPWYGNGTGDVQDNLDRVYEEKGYTQAAERHLNAHNLFLQTWLALGIPGLMLVVGLFILMISQAIRAQDAMQIAFASLFLLISLTESTFNVQAGVVFFSFFAVLLARRNKAHNLDSLDEID